MRFQPYNSAGTNSEVNKRGGQPFSLDFKIKSRNAVPHSGLRGGPVLYLPDFVSTKRTHGFFDFFWCWVWLDARPRQIS